MGATPCSLFNLQFFYFFILVSTRVFSLNMLISLFGGYWQSVDLSKLEIAALKRYRRHFKLVISFDHFEWHH
jgi:hypothetical protein